MELQRLILSRKGFDSASGGCPSPIFPDGTMFSLPIPDPRSGMAYRDLRYGDLNVGDLVADLTGNRIRSWYTAHLDPDISSQTWQRAPGWRGLLGQTGIAERHLQKQEVDSGDVFLFFGLYRHVEKVDGHWRFVKGALKQHILWGWLQIEQASPVDDLKRAPEFQWARYHPHFRYDYNDLNTLYISSESLNLGDGDLMPGAGVFSKIDERLVLTRPDGKSVSEWRLPQFFHPGCWGEKEPLTYHTNLARWRRAGEYAHLQSVGRGQEFVLNLAHYPEAMDWILDLVAEFGES